MADASRLCPRPRQWLGPCLRTGGAGTQGRVGHLRLSKPLPRGSGSRLPGQRSSQQEQLAEFSGPTSPCGSHFGFPCIRVSWRGRNTPNKLCILGKNWFWLLPVTPAGAGWPLHPCVQFKPKPVKRLYLAPWISYLYRPCDSTSVFKPPWLRFLEYPFHVLLYPFQVLLYPCSNARLPARYAAEGQK